MSSSAPNGPSVAYYLSGHGFGHATRAVLVMEALHRLAPGLRLHVRSVVSPALLKKYLRIPHTLSPVALDVGVVEKNIFEIDVAETAKAWRRFEPKRESLIAAEAQWLRRAGVDVVVFDVPPAAASAAALTGIPSVAISNFTWDFIYGSYLEEAPEMRRAVELCREDYAKTTLALRLPLGHSFDQFPSVMDVPLVARKTDADRAGLRKDLGLTDERPSIVVALRGATTDLVVDGSRVDILSFGELQGRGVRHLGSEWDDRFSEVVVAADLVLSKPGYGVCSECIVNQRPLLHLPRFGFPEADLLIRGMSPIGYQRQVLPSDLANGQKLFEICRELGSHNSLKKQDLHGADVCAGHILSLVSW